jgi:hypothetical protein
VCLVVGRPRATKCIPHLSLATGWSAFVANRPETLKYVEVDGYALYCPWGVADFRHYLGPEAEFVSRLDPIYPRTWF